MKKIILLTILTFGLITTGCLKQNQAVEKWEFENNDTSNEVENNKQDITDKTINENKNSTDQNIFIDNTEGTENWRVYEKKDQNVKIKYHKNWYYDRDEQAEKKLGYDLYVGFAESPEILAQGAPYPIGFIIADIEKLDEINKKLDEINKNRPIRKFEHFIITEKNNKKYILTGEDEYQNILDKMTDSFEFLDK